MESLSGPQVSESKEGLQHVELMHCGELTGEGQTGWIGMNGL